ncbi:DUF1294 domain-containing protein [Rhizobium herbae]|uniref:Uncharacterized membrane protein YsdA (DUF1294 family) n=1 Tax=Rhizobium herbae TaxID=508661 RepID=A0ABS4ESL3_9HYPH|nr:DUF1294 domain-containing protein [Rhizobium herbae]MBP1860941.1 uncharacterized membrane protein YsdA (DUF1294 family) [Rhizobium herbae]
MTTSQTIVLIILLINIITFCVFWWDKDAAREGHWRVPESRLLGLALIGGSLGAVAGQELLRHKTRKEPFRTELMLIVTLHIAALAAWLSAPIWFPYALAFIR